MAGCTDCNDTTNISRAHIAQSCICENGRRARCRCSTFATPSRLQVNLAMSTPLSSKRTNPAAIRPIPDFLPVLGPLRCQPRIYAAVHPPLRQSSAKAQALPCFNASTSLTHLDSHGLLKDIRPFHPLRHISPELILCAVSPGTFPGGGVLRRLSAAT